MENQTIDGLGTVSALVKRFHKAREYWDLWRSLHQEAFDYANPQRQTFTEFSPGQKKNRQIFDDTAVIGLEQFASRIQASLVPSWQQWCNFVAGDDVPKEDEKKVNDLLETVTDTFFSHLNHSNFSTEISPSFSDLGIGTGAIQIDEGMFNEDEPVFKFSNVPLAELYPENLKNIWRNQEIELGLVKETWPEASLPDTIEKKAKEKPYEKECFINGMLFNLEDRKYHQVIIHEKKKHIVFHQDFNTMRLIMFRWHVVPGERFGRGPIIQMLPSIRTANKVEQFILQNAAIQMAGVYTGVDDGIFNPHTVRIAPGTVIPVKSNSSQNPTLMPLGRAGDLGLGNFVLENIQERIRKALYADPLGEITDPVRTATEIMIRQQEMLKHSGASIGRLKTELIEPLVAACIDILVSLGKVASIKVDGKEVTIKHVSPLAKAEDTEDFQNSQLWFSMVSQLPLPIAVASAKFEEFPAYWQEKLGVSADLVRDKDERDSEIAKAVQALVMQQAQEQQGGGESV